VQKMVEFGGGNLYWFLDTHSPPCVSNVVYALCRYKDKQLLSLLLFAFVLWFLLINYVSVLAHFLTVIIVCWEAEF